MTDDLHVDGEGRLWLEGWHVGWIRPDLPATVRDRLDERIDAANRDPWEGDDA